MVLLKLLPSAELDHWFHLAQGFSTAKPQTVADPPKGFLAIQQRAAWRSTVQFGCETRSSPVLFTLTYTGWVQRLRLTPPPPKLSTPQFWGRRCPVQNLCPLGCKECARSLSYGFPQIAACIKPQHSGLCSLMQEVRTSFPRTGKQTQKSSRRQLRFPFCHQICIVCLANCTQPSERSHLIPK